MSGKALLSWLVVLVGGDLDGRVAGLMVVPSGWKAVQRVVALSLQNEFRSVGLLYVESMMKAARLECSVLGGAAGLLGLLLEELRNNN